jgi:hypothetical protein
MSAGISSKSTEFPLPESVPDEENGLNKQEYVPLRRIFDTMDAYRICHVIGELKGYTEKYREDREKVSFNDYVKIHEQYLKDIKEAVKEELEVQKIEPKKRIIRGGLIALIGYCITIPLIVAFPEILLPYLLPEMLMGLIAEESGRNIYKGVSKRRGISKDIDFIDKMPLDKLAYALEDICYYPAKTDREKNALLLEKEDKNKALKKAVKGAVEYVVPKVYNRISEKVRLPEKLDSFNRRMYNKVLHYTVGSK